jgi:hypothetical protein
VGGANLSKCTPPSLGTKTPSGTSEWKCGVTCKAEPKLATTAIYVQPNMQDLEAAVDSLMED